MNNWNTDAGNISDESSFDNTLLLKTYQIEDFLNTQRDNLFFVIGPKGFGKTFVLKAKSILYRRDGIPIIHDNILVDKPGSASYIFSQDKLSLFSNLQSWTNLWTASIILAVLKKFNVLSSVQDSSPLIEKLSSCPATTITSYCKTILALSRSDFFVLVEDLNKFLISAMERINSPIAAFIDNVDEYFDVHIDTKQDQQSVSGQTSKDIWYLSQIGLVESIYQITSKNRHLKVFVAIRKEAFKRIPMYDSKSIQYEGNCIDLTYSPEDFREMLCLNIKREAKEHLCFPDSLEKDPLYAFFGISIVAQSYIQDEKEDIFQYIMRHTLQRPRDFMHIGRQVKYMRPKERTPNALKLKINEAASEIARSYLKEVSPHIGDITFEKLFTLIDTNILSCDDVKRICSLYNSIECSASECKTCSGQHIFCTLYSIGLLGYAKKDQVTDDIYQEFLSPGVKSFDILGNLPPVDYFLIHPCLYGPISDINQNFKPNRTNIVGPNRSLINYLKWHGFKAERSENKIYSFPKIEGQRCHVHFGAGKLGWGLVIPLIGYIHDSGNPNW